MRAGIMAEGVPGSAPAGWMPEKRGGGGGNRGKMAEHI